MGAVEPAIGQEGGIPKPLAPLAARRKNDEPYGRRPDVAEEIRRALAASPLEWLPGELQSETIVHLLRWLRPRGHETTFGKLVHELGRRIARVVADNAHGFDHVTAEQIALDVGKDILGWVVTPTPSRQSEFLEAAFREAVKRRTLNRVEWHQRRPRAVQFDLVKDELDDGHYRGIGPVEGVEDKEMGPEAYAIEGEQIRVGLDGIRNPKHREAIILRYLQGWPISNDDPNTPTLCTHFRVDPRQINNWLNTALAQMREAMGDVI